MKIHFFQKKSSGRPSWIKLGADLGRFWRPKGSQNGTNTEPKSDQKRSKKIVKKKNRILIDFGAQKGAKMAPKRNPKQNKIEHEIQHEKEAPWDLLGAILGRYWVVLGSLWGSRK